MTRLITMVRSNRIYALSSIYVSTFVSIHASIYVCMCVFVSMYVHVFIFISIYLYIFLPILLPIYLSIYLDDFDSLRHVNPTQNQNEYRRGDMIFDPVVRTLMLHCAHESIISAGQGKVIDTKGTTTIKVPDTITNHNYRNGHSQNTNKNKNKDKPSTGGQKEATQTNHPHHVNENTGVTMLELLTGPLEQVIGVPVASSDSQALTSVGLSTGVGGGEA